MFNLSIITVVRNDVHGLQKTYDSIVKARESTFLTGLDFEWIVADGNSSDGTAELMRHLESLGQFPIRGNSASDGGIYDAMNAAVHRSSGDYLWFVNAGDEIANEEATRKDVGSFASTIRSGEEKTVYMFGYFLMGTSTATARKARKESYLNYSLPTSHQALIYPRTAFTSGAYYLPDYKVCGDYAHACLLKTARFKFSPVDAAIVRFYLGGTSTQRRRALMSEASQVQKKILKLGPAYRLLSYLRRYATTKYMDRFL